MQYNTTKRKASANFHTYSLKPIASIINIEQACHEIYKDN